MRTILGLAILYLAAVESRAKEPATSETPSAGAVRNDINGDPLPEGAVARIGTNRLRCQGGSQGTLLGFSSDAKRLVSVGHGWIYHWDPGTGRLIRRVKGHDGAEQNGSGTVYTALSGDTATAAFWTVAAIHLWDTDSGRERLAIPWQRKGFTPFQQLALSSDGTLLAVTPDVPEGRNWDDRSSPISLWDARTGEKKHLLVGHSASIGALAFSHDGRTLVSIGEDHTLFAWDVEAGKQRFRIELPADERPQSLAVSADDKMVAICSYRDTEKNSESVLSFRDLTDGKSIRPLKSEFTDVYAVAFSSDGRLVALSRANYSTQKQTVALCDLKSGQPLRQFRIAEVGGLSRLVFAPGSNTLAGCSDRCPRIHLWDVKAGRELATPAGDDNFISPLLFTNHGSTLLTHCSDRLLKLWDAQTGAPLPLPVEKSDDAAMIVPSFDGKTLISAETAAKRLRVWDANTGKTLRSVTVDLEAPNKNEPAAKLRAFTLGADGKTLFTAVQRFTEKPGWYYETQARDLTTGNLIRTWNWDQDGIALFSPDGRLTLSYKGVVRETATGRELCRFRPEQESAIQPVGDYSQFAIPRAFSRDGRLVGAIAADSVSGPGITRQEHHVLQVWELASRGLVFAIDVPQNVCSTVALSNAGRMLISAGSTGMVVWDIATERPVVERRLSNDYVMAMLLSADRRRLATAFTDTTVLIWDVAALLGPQKAPAANEIKGQDDLNALWTDLASPEARRGQAAVRRFVGSPEKSVAWLQDHLHPVEAVPADRMKQLVGELDSPRFAEREKAFEELRKADLKAESGLQQALDANPSAETRGRIESLLASIRSDRGPERLRGIRALQVLEAIATPDAIKVLKRLARGAPGSRLTRDAEESHERALASSN